MSPATASQVEATEAGSTRATLTLSLSTGYFYHLAPFVLFDPVQSFQARNDETRHQKWRIHSFPTYPCCCIIADFVYSGRRDARCLAGAALEGLAEEEELELIVDGQHTSTGDTTQDVGTGTLEEGLDTLLGNDLLEGIGGGLVLDGLTRGHHHTPTDSVKRVRGDTGTGGDAPTEEERSEEVASERTDQDDGLDGVVHAEVQTTVDDDTSDGGTEATVQTSDTIGGEGLAVDVHESVELTLTVALGRLGVVGQTGTGVVEGVDEKQGSGASSLD